MIILPPVTGMAPDLRLLLGVVNSDVLWGPDGPQSDLHLLPDKAEAPDVGATPTPQSTPEPEPWAYFWRSVYRTSLSLLEARTLLPPIGMFEFCKGATMAPKEKSFVFACLLCTAPLLIPELVGHGNIANLRMIPPKLPLLSEEQLRNMAAWHLVDLLEMGIVQEVDSAPLEVLTSGDRMQYLQESKTFKSVPMLEEARWRSVDVVGCANSSANAITDMEVITDMAMLLNLVELEPSAFLIRWSVIVLTLIFLAASPPERLVAYFQVQQAFQFARCALLGKCSRSRGASLINLYDICDDVFRRGWKIYQETVAGYVFDEPPPDTSWIKYYNIKRLKEVGLWPLFINPFRLSTDDWHSLQDTEPYRGVPLAEALDAMTRNPPEIHMSVKKGVRLLREHVVEAFGKLPGASADRATLLRPSQEKNTLVRSTDVTTPLNWILKPSPLTTFAEHLDWVGADSFVLAFRQWLAVGLANAQRPTEGEFPVIEWPDPPAIECVPIMLAPNLPINAMQYRQSTDRERVKTLVQLELWASTTLPSESPTTSFIRQTKQRIFDDRKQDNDVNPPCQEDVCESTDEAGQSDSEHEHTDKVAERLALRKRRMLRKLELNRETRRKQEATPAKPLPSRKSESKRKVKRASAIGSTGSPKSSTPSISSSKHVQGVPQEKSETYVKGVPPPDTLPTPALIAEEKPKPAIAPTAQPSLLAAPSPRHYAPFGLATTQASGSILVGSIECVSLQSCKSI